MTMALKKSFDHLLSVAAQGRSAHTCQDCVNYFQASLLEHCWNKCSNMLCSLRKWSNVFLACILFLLIIKLYLYIDSVSKFTDELSEEDDLKNYLSQLQFTPNDYPRCDIKRKWRLLDWLVRREKGNWIPGSCLVSKSLRYVTLSTKLGNFSLYIYDSGKIDPSVSKRALAGEIFENVEIVRFLQITNPLPLIDVGANVGLVTLQALKQGRDVVAVEPVLGNALRLCRSALDFHSNPRFLVVQNAVSSVEGNVTLVSGGGSTLFQVQKESVEMDLTKAKVTALSIHLDRLLEVIPFRQAALKIDVESHEGHVLAGAHRLFQTLDIPYVWMEWEHVKSLTDYGGKFVIKFMRTYDFEPYDILTGEKLFDEYYMGWPFTVLWYRSIP